ncbi:hypothetical protein [Actinomadura rupiterrae]|uniref:hypothetical protein n=1 Tax=Actinomadura rupiterrae TaxID=559627 RepID=UPI0020A5433A|nr:hypothetical protein [Actinomadura rupiterrae]MCP2337024.1 HAMP domain-containing protein [Actinomadura rupiterrae]
MTTTVILVLLCLAIAGRELYLASDKRLPRAQAELRELRDRVADLTRRQDALRAEVDRSIQSPASELRPVEVSGTPPEQSGRLDDLADRVDRAEKELGALSGRFAELELDRDAQRALASSLDDVEQDVRELRQEMLDRLASERGVVAGLLLSEEGEAGALLTESFERCAAEYGLRIRIREERMAEAGNGGFAGTSYYLSGRRPDALAEELFGHVRSLYDPQDPSGLTALLTELAHLRGGGLVRFGAFTAVRTHDILLCGLLPEDDASSADESGDPWTLAARVRDLPDDQQCDLTWLHADE